ncbi:MAG TPA: hypothetical protein VFV17_06340 [Usitatibacteraceae bacterium]|nr:hypothetical protein [Usitatibacteraceae bacterium]
MNPLLDWIFFGPARLVAGWPLAGVALGLGLLAAGIWQHASCGAVFDASLFRRAPMFAGLCWWIFTAYESQIQAVAGSQPGWAFRIDLVFLVPLLYVMTAAALLTIVGGASKRKPASDQDASPRDPQA